MSIFVKRNSGYYISRIGITGSRAKLSETLGKEVEKIKKHISSPIAIGFGISKPSHVTEVSKLGQGVIVASELVKSLAESVDDSRKVRNYLDKAHRYQDAIYS